MRRISSTGNLVKWIPGSSCDSAWKRMFAGVQRFWEIPDKRCAFSGMTLLGWFPPIRHIGSCRGMTIQCGIPVGFEMAVESGAAVLRGKIVGPGAKG
jgi:hypothetical protein